MGDGGMRSHLNDFKLIFLTKLKMIQEVMREQYRISFITLLTDSYFTIHFI